MTMRIAFKHMESSEALSDYATEKLEPVITRYIPAHTDIQIALSVEHGKHIAHLNINGGGEHIHLHAEQESMYHTIDHLVMVLDEKLRRNKTKHTHHDRDSIRYHTPESMVTEDDDEELEELEELEEQMAK